MSDENLYINDLLHRNSGYSFTETLTNGMYTVSFIDGSGVTQYKANGLTLIDAYRKIRGDVLDGANPLFRLTTTERDALTNIETATVIDHITFGRSEIWDGTTWKNVSRRSTITGIIASTTQSQGQGLLTGDINIITTVANNNDVVTLPQAEYVEICIVLNVGTKKLMIYPYSGDDLGEGEDEPVSLAAGSNIRFRNYNIIYWMVI